MQEKEAYVERGLGIHLWSSGVFDAQISHILEILFFSFLTPSSTQKTDKIEHYIVLQAFWDIFMLLHT